MRQTTLEKTAAAHKKLVAALKSRSKAEAVIQDFVQA
jgi:hypothetical protein